MNASYNGRPISEMPLSLRFFGSVPANSPAWLVDQGLRLGRRVTRVEELVDGPEVDRQGIHLAVVRGVHAVHVVREACETVHVVPDPLVGRVEQVRAVLVDLRAGLLVHVAVRVAADMVAHVDDLDPRAQVLDGLLGHGQAEQARAHDHQIGILHRISHNKTTFQTLSMLIAATQTHRDGVRFLLKCTRASSRCGEVRAWCNMARASAWRYVTQLPQGRNAARVSGLFRVRGGFSISSPIRSPQ